MQRSTLLLLSLCLTASLFARQAHFAPRAAFADETADLTGQIKVALSRNKGPGDLRDGTSFAEAYRYLFYKAGPGGIRALQMDRNDSISLQAAWQEVVLSVPAINPGPSCRPDRQKLTWFLGFLEGRIRVKAPEWWAEAVLDAQARSRYRTYFNSGSLGQGPYHAAGLDDIQAPSDTVLARKGDRIMLRVGDEEILTAAGSSLCKAIDGAGSGISAAINKKRAYVALHEAFGFPCDLWCFDRDSGEKLWKARIWGTFWGAADGAGDHWVSVVDLDDRVLIFGRAFAGINVEGFDAKDGSNLFRFASSY